MLARIARSLGINYSERIDTLKVKYRWLESQANYARDDIEGIKQELAELHKEVKNAAKKG